jgi:hypothetical protein
MLAAPFACADALLLVVKVVLLAVGGAVFRVGAIVTVNVGSSVGILVGSSVGKKVGPSEGMTEGGGVGSEVIRT